MKKMVSALVAAVLAGCILTGCGGTTAADPGGTGTADAQPEREGALPASAPVDDSWFADAAVWAVKEGITNGTGNNTFTPDKTCSRGEILTFLYRQFS